MKIFPTSAISIPKSKLFSSIIIIFCCFLFFTTNLWAGEYTITQLTNNSVDDNAPQIHNGQVAWYGSDADQNDWEIFLYDGTQTTSLTDNDYYDAYPQIHNGQVTWYGSDGNDYEIFLYDGIQTIQLTNNDYNDAGQQIHNGQITWVGHPSFYEFEIYLYNGSQTVQLTDNHLSAHAPQIHNDHVAWYGWDDYGLEIFLYDGAQITQLTDSYDSRYPQIHNGQVTWSGYDGNDYEIFFYDGTQTMQLTDNDYYDAAPQIHNGQVTWFGSDGNDYEIFLYDGIQTIQITDNTYDDYSSQIHNGQITWYGYDGNDTEIFLATKELLEILDGVDFSAGKEVSDDPEKLAVGGFSVKGAVSDGVTRLLLRLKLDELNEVTFSLEGTGDPDEDGVLRSINGEQEGESITVYTESTSEGEVAFAIYQAPKNFVRSGNNEDENVSERTISLNVKSNRSPSFELSEEIVLVRPPVILVHGLWSGPDMWNNFRDMLENELLGIHIFTADYEDDNASHFEVNQDVLKKQIIITRSELRLERIAMIQTDIVGHSMGGLLARIHAGGDNWYYKGYYANDKNFLMGDINKLITLDSPHYGSFLADAGITCMRGPHSEDMDFLVELMKQVGMSLTDGAVNDMMTTSGLIEKMNGIKIIPPSHAISGDYTEAYLATYVTPDGETKWVVEGLPHVKIVWGILYFNPYNILNVLIEEGYGGVIIPAIDSGSDLVISIYSQEGGLTSSASSSYYHHHMDATGQDVADRVIELLNTSVDNLLFNSGFPVK